VSNDSLLLSLQASGVTRILCQGGYGNQAEITEISTIYMYTTACNRLLCT